MPNTHAIARRIVARATAVEPIVTNYIKGPATHGRLIGLSHAVKQQDRVESKLRRSSSNRTTVNDSLRYTIIFEDAEYHKGVYQFIRTLRLNKSINMKEIRRRNDWGGATGYKGINSTFVKEGLMDEAGSALLYIEVQFHTPRSYDAVKQIHGNYEVMRELDDSDAEKQRLDDIAITVFSEIVVVSLGGAVGADIGSFEWNDTRNRGASRLSSGHAGHIDMRSLPPMQ
ncbi:hypothetical protein A9Q99_11450 [Gammaproteobacteria bacterium 45_16_T64]|nr:hypothetical protein A9Q99_11450 [Gammaproteobacteria bacterium 45_16_T64]